MMKSCQLKPLRILTELLIWRRIEKRKLNGQSLQFRKLICCQKQGRNSRTAYFLFSSITKTWVTVYWFLQMLHWSLYCGKIISLWKIYSASFKVLEYWILITTIELSKSQYYPLSICLSQLKPRNKRPLYKYNIYNRSAIQEFRITNLLEFYIIINRAS